MEIVYNDYEVSKFKNRSTINCVCEKFFFANLVTYYDDVPRILYTWFFDQGPMLFLAYSSFLTILSVTL